MKLPPLCSIQALIRYETFRNSKLISAKHGFLQIELCHIAVRHLFRIRPGLIKASGYFQRVFTIFAAVYVTLQFLEM